MPHGCIMHRFIVVNRRSFGAKCLDACLHLCRKFGYVFISVQKYILVKHKAIDPVVNKVVAPALHEIESHVIKPALHAVEDVFGGIAQALLGGGGGQQAPPPQGVSEDQTMLLAAGGAVLLLLVAS